MSFSLLWMSTTVTSDLVFTILYDNLRVRRACSLSTGVSHFMYQSTPPHCLTSRYGGCEAVEREWSAAGRRRRSSHMKAATDTDYRQEQRTMDTLCFSAAAAAARASHQQWMRSYWIIVSWDYLQTVPRSSLLLLLLAAININIFIHRWVMWLMSAT